MEFQNNSTHQQIILGLKRLTWSLLSVFFIIFFFWLCLLATKKYDGDVLFIDLFYSSFTNLDNFIGILKQFAPFLIGAVAVLICFQIGFVNLGVAGQMTVAGLVAFLLANYLNTKLKPEVVASYKILWTTLIFLTVLMVVFFIAMFTASLKLYFGINEILTTIMLNYVFMYIYRFVVTHPNFTNPIGKSQTMNNVDNLMGINFVVGNLIPISLFIAFFIITILLFVFTKTSYGFKIKIIGLNPKAAKYAGINNTRQILYLVSFSGILSGLAGIFYYFRSFDNTHLFLEESLPSNGFDTISIVWLSQGSFLALPFVTFFVAMMRYQQNLIVTSDLQPQTVEVILGFVLMFVALVNRFLTMSKHDKTILKTKLLYFANPILNFFKTKKEEYN